MSNTVTLTPTKFENLRSGCTSFGYRAYDDDGQAYDNTVESIPNDDIEFLAMVAETDNKEVRAMLDFVINEKKGIEIDGMFYGWDKIKTTLLAE